jgi:hypothetical protein
MSTTLSFGYKLPQTGDKGSTFFPDLEFDITRLNGHSHNGTDSDRLTAKNFVKNIQQINSGFSALGNGLQKTTVTAPSGYQVGTLSTTFPAGSTIASIRFYITSTGEEISPKYVRLSTTQYDLYLPTSLSDVLAVYG